MTFSVETLKQQVADKLAEIKQWLDRRRKQDLPYLVYGTVAGLTLWPIVEAAVQSGQFWPAVGAMYAVAGGVGGNLIAEQLQRWKDRAQPPTETEVADWVSTQVQSQPELRQAIDALLERLQALPQAQTHLPVADRAWFDQTLQTELAQLGNLTRFQAIFTGDTQIAIGEGQRVVQGKGVIVEGDLHGSVTLADTIQQIVDPTQMTPAALRQAYLRRVLADHNQLLLSGVDPKLGAENERLELSAVYTTLLTETRAAVRQTRQRELPIVEPEERQGPRRSALDMLNQQPHLVLLGDPGSGKSTFVNFVAACLAGEAVDHPQVNQALLTRPLPPEPDEEQRRRPGEPKPEAKPQPWDHGPLLPVCIVLRDFAASGLPAAGQPATVAHLWRFVTRQLEQAALAEYTPLLKKELLEQGGLFLFDGLDEVPTADNHRVHIKQMVEDVARTFTRCRILITSRTYAYQQQDWRLPTFVETMLAPFTPGQITAFVSRWYTHIAQVRGLNRDDAQGQAVLLQQAILGNQRLLDLAERPLLLTLMASLHAWRGGSLPEKREELYADAVDLLLDTWERQRIVRDAQGQVQIIQPSLQQWLNVDRDKVRGLLERLAFAAHAGQPDLEGTADIAESDLVMGLLKLSDNKELPPARLVEYLSQRAGLLLPRGVGVYAFPHRTFQEYLAAVHLTRSGYPGEVARLARQEPNRWREVALLAGARAARGSAYALWGLVHALCYGEPGAADTAAAHWGARLAGQFLVESADLEAVDEPEAEHLARVRRWLVSVLSGDRLPPRERAAAGVTLARLGDPRPEVMDVDAMQFCLVPAADFYMGEGKESPRCGFLDYAYWLGQYPVTNAQYNAFVAADGYRKARYWQEAIDAGVWKNGAYYSRTRPYDYGPQYQWDNLPVIGVSWYEALAFSRWTTERWRQRGWLPDGWQVTLPSEAEWEKAARGGVLIPEAAVILPIAQFRGAPAVSLAANPDPQRLYPWLPGVLSPEWANYKASDIGQTSSVGCFSRAASVYGCQEMLGNVWEWTRSWEKKYPYDPHDGRETLARGRTDWTIVRGGAFYSDSVRCPLRVRNLPDYESRNYGFRLALSPF